MLRLDPRTQRNAYLTSPDRLGLFRVAHRTDKDAIVENCFTLKRERISLRSIIAAFEFLCQGEDILD